MARHTDNNLKGFLLGACNCDWGCPCNFEVAPSYGYCEGMYVWHVASGHFNGTTLDGSTFALYNTFPGAVHEGNGTSLFLIDERVPAERRPAIESMVQTISPFSVFLDLTTTMLGFRYVPFDLQLDGIHSRLTIPDIFELQLGPIINPVTGEEELATLSKPMGFTSKVQELCSAVTHRFGTDGIHYDHPGKYGEFSPFEYPLG